VIHFCITLEITSIGQSVLPSINYCYLPRRQCITWVILFSYLKYPIYISRKRLGLGRGFSYLIPLTSPSSQSQYRSANWARLEPRPRWAKLLVWASKWDATPTSEAKPPLPLPRERVSYPRVVHSETPSMWVEIRKLRILLPNIMKPMVSVGAKTQDVSLKINA
jgi:hypothetical protein